MKIDFRPSRKRHRQFEAYWRTTHTLTSHFTGEGSQLLPFTGVMQNAQKCFTYIFCSFESLDLVLFVGTAFRVTWLSRQPIIRKKKAVKCGRTLLIGLMTLSEDKRAVCLPGDHSSVLKPLTHFP
jgi:hypothetical protein